MSGIDMSGMSVGSISLSGASVGATCSAEPGCITCGDVAVVLTVATVEGSDAQCHDELGREELVAIELVGEVAPGDRLLVHAGVAIERVGDGGVTR
jgi:hydrogenase maturation factor